MTDPAETAVTFYCDDDFDLEKIFECGQCFRWNRDEDGSYTGVAFKKAARIRKDGNDIVISGTKEDLESVWRRYFDLDRRYDAVRKSLAVDDYMTAATEYGAGIRILRQEPWEALCSFIISQCNNIPRIKGIVERFCERFGDPISFEGKTVCAFPDAEKIAGLKEDDLGCLRCGYRAPYIIEAARAVTEGRLDLEKLSQGSFENALCALKSVKGIGDKVANCVILFGLGMTDAFPRDVWIKRAVKEHYGSAFTPDIFAPNAGIAQQYMFYYRRAEG